MNATLSAGASDGARPVNLRREWIDVAKGLSIVLVVLMHSTLGVETALGREGWLHAVVAFAEPFRIPTFFLVAGLFASRTVAAPWRRTLNGKVLHFAYFYLLWMSLQYGVKSGGVAARDPAGFAAGWANHLVEPLGTLWFIHVLPLFFLAARLLRSAPPLLVLAGATLLALAPVHTGWTTIDEFAARFVFFCAGWLGAPLAFALADRAAQRARPALILLAVWAVVNGGLVVIGASRLSAVHLALGFAGAAAAIAASALLVRTGAHRALALAGQRSIVIYLAFFLPMAATRSVLVATGLVTDAGLAAAIVTAAAVVVPLLLHGALRAAGLGGFLFERPAWARLPAGADGATRPRPSASTA
jgi:uncharacterized membrane protein YcfT